MGCVRARRAGGGIGVQRGGKSGEHVEDPRPGERLMCRRPSQVLGRDRRAVVGGDRPHRRHLPFEARNLAILLFETFANGPHHKSIVG